MRQEDQKFKVSLGYRESLGNLMNWGVVAHTENQEHGQTYMASVGCIVRSYFRNKPQQRQAELCVFWASQDYKVSQTLSQNKTQPKKQP